MINGHGDDIFNYSDIRMNFSSNVYAHFNHAELFQHLAEIMPRVRNYPSPSPDRLEEALAQHHGISPREVMVTNGATEAIYLIAQAYRHLNMVIPQPAFSEYADACRIYQGVRPLDKCGTMTWLCIPNNPTGEVMDKEKLPSGMLVLDASYAAYTTKPLLSAREAVERGDILMLRSMTKDYGIPGIRLGYVIANEQMLQPLRSLRMPWSIGTIALEAGCYLLRHHQEYLIPAEMLNTERQRIAEALRKKGILSHPSDSNILLCHGNSYGTAAELKDRLAKEHGILIRDASNFPGLTPQHFRIAAQTPAENDYLITGLSGKTGISR